jgi:Yip1-like protein
MKALVIRVKDILLRTGPAWQAIKDEPATYRDVLLHYVAPLAAIPPAAAVAGRLLFDRNIADNSLSSSFAYLLMTNLIWYGMYVVNVFITGMIIAAVLTGAGSRWNGLRGLTLAAYSFTPLSLAGLTAVIPSLGWTLYPAILYALYLLYRGMMQLTGFPGTKAAWVALSSFSAAAIIVGVMNLFEYMFESYVTRGVFTLPG